MADKEAQVDWDDVRRELHDERVRRDEWKKMYYQAVAGTEVERLRAELAQLQAERIAIQNDQCVLTCVYCGYQYPPGTPVSNHKALSEHIRSCPAHPLAGVLAELAQVREELAYVHQAARDEYDEIETELYLTRAAAQEMSDEVREFWLSPAEAEQLRAELAQAIVAQADAELAAHVHDKACGELAQTVRTERALRRETEQRAEALAALVVNEETAGLLEKLASHTRAHCYHPWYSDAEAARALAAEIRKALEETE